MFRVPVSGSLVKTSGNVMNGPPSPGQHVRIGRSSSVPSRFTTSWHGASFTVFGIRSASRPTTGRSFRASITPFGAGGVMRSSISFSRSSSLATPSASCMRSREPKMLVATGMSKPEGLSNNNAGPPCGDLHARSVTAAISSVGLTRSAIRTSCRRLSRSARNSERSLYIGQRHLLDDPGRELECAAAVLTGYRRRPTRPNGVDEVHELSLQRLLLNDLDGSALNGWHRAILLYKTPDLDLLRGIVD